MRLLTFIILTLTLSGITVSKLCADESKTPQTSVTQKAVTTLQTKFFLPFLTNSLQQKLDHSNGPKKVDATALLTALGITNCHTVSLSNTPKGKAWMSEIQLHISENPTGIFTLPANSDTTTLSPFFAPSGTDIAAQISLSPSALKKLLLSLSKVYGAEEQTQTWLDKQFIDKSIAKHLDQPLARLHLAVDFDAKHTINLGRVVIGQPHLLLRVDGANEIIDAFFLHLRNFRGVPFLRKESNTHITYQLPAYVKEASANLLPYVSIDKQKGSAIITSTEEFYKHFLTTGANISEDEKFQATWKGMPDSGSLMLYLSKRAINSTATIYQKALDEQWTNNPTFLKNEPTYTRFINELNSSENGFALSISPHKDGQTITLTGPLIGSFFPLFLRK